MIKFNVAFINLCTEAEGPHKRLAIWFQGCKKRCQGCCNPQYIDIKPANIVSLNELHNIVSTAKDKFDLEGVTYLGGEPTLQKGLSKLSKKIKEMGLGIILFTGYKVSEINQEIKKSVDLIIDGSYEKWNQEDKRNLIGSKNQKIIHITDRYRLHENWFYNLRPKHIEINLKENLYFTGDVFE